MQKNILFVCRFNRFRSKFAEAYFNEINQDKNFSAKSAGLIQGNPIDKDLYNLATHHGLNISGKPKGLNEEILDWQNIIVVVADNVPLSVFNDHRIATDQILLWDDVEEHENDKTVTLIKEKVFDFLQTLAS